MPPKWLWRRRKWIRRRLEPLMAPGFGYTIHRVQMPRSLPEGGDWMEDMW